MDENNLKITPDVSSVVSEIRSVIDAAVAVEGAH